MQTLHPNKTVVRVPEHREINPLTAITIAVDTAYIAAQQGRNVNQGIYMMDNMVANGSTKEGTLELHTKCPVGSLIGFNTVAINGEGTSQDQVIITGFTVSNGSVFTAAGQPQQQTSPGHEPPGSYWVGQALNTGTQTYQIQIKVMVGILHPVSYFINWDPFITAQ
ncbi:MAG: hypothetical protein F6K58_09280 [Symploca sp. SIO2E9]|nr:hypothetical protein [Symploca sp. SIO2E9]